jgi:hypothetical protein
MYWSRTGSYLDLAQWLLVSILASGGGWLVCRTLFRPRPRERIFLGIASGLLLLTLASNLFALLMPLNLAFWTAALLIFAIGLVIGWRVRPLIKFTMSEFSHWQLYLLFGALFFLFAAINRGLAIFDDYSNLPLVSIIAAGDFPPRFYLNPEQVFSYHYGLHILAAGLVRVGGLFPWSAWDLYKALGISLTMMLGLLWFRRFMGWRAVLLLAGTLILFSGGTRWLLLFIPEPILKGISQNINMIGSGIANSTDLYSGLLSPWKAQGEGPISFPFAFVNGIYQPLIIREHVRRDPGRDHPGSVDPMGGFTLCPNRAELGLDNLAKHLVDPCIGRRGFQSGTKSIWHWKRSDHTEYFPNGFTGDRTALAAGDTFSSFRRALYKPTRQSAGCPGRDGAGYIIGPDSDLGFDFLPALWQASNGWYQPDDPAKLFHPDPDSISRA